MAGSISLSLTQRYDKTSHEPLDGGLLYFYAAGTTTPQSAYQDISLTIPWPNPITLDSGGNVPQLFFDDGYIKFRLSNADGVTQIEADFVLVLGPTSGVGAAPSVDATTILATGDIKTRYGTGVLTGFVRANGRTIGSATSGASERANADTEALFLYLWTEDAGLAVSTGRGASAAADWAANKNIALPDWRGRVIAGFDDMGNSAANRLTAAGGMSGSGIGGASSSQARTLAANQIPTITSVNASQAISVAATNFLLEQGVNTTTGVPATGGTGVAFSSLAGASATHAASTGNNSISTTYTNGSQQDVYVVQPTMFATIYMKL